MNIVHQLLVFLGGALVDGMIAEGEKQNSITSVNNNGYFQKLKLWLFEIRKLISMQLSAKFGGPERGKFNSVRDHGVGTERNEIHKGVHTSFYHERMRQI